MGAVDSREGIRSSTVLLGNGETRDNGPDRGLVVRVKKRQPKGTVPIRPWRLGSCRIVTVCVEGGLR